VAELSSVEGIKAQSRQLRGTLAGELAAGGTHFATPSTQLLKFHGIYQQDDRDERKERNAAGAGPAYSFMLRTKSPGGFVPAALFLALERLADAHGSGTMRVTTRQGFQLHGVEKTELRETIRTIAETLGSTLGACGDINRNVMAPAAPFAAPAYRVARETAHAIADLLTPQTGAYVEIWVDDERVATSEPEVEPIYGTTYLPRKFKVAVAAPGDNSVDIFTNDIGVVPLLGDNGTPLGFDLYVGGGLGMTHRKPQTYPRLASEFGFVAPDRLLSAVKAIVEVQRDYGDRTNRKHARLKYTIDDRGLDWFRAEVERQAGFALEPFRSLPAWEFRDYLGWHEQGDGRLFLGLSVENGRVRDGDGAQLKSALRLIVERFGLDLVLTPNHNILLVGIPREERGAIDGILASAAVRPVEAIAPIERFAMACPALPTCGQALTEAERVLPSLVDRLEGRLRELGLQDEPITLRMTGCPNGCARPYMGEIGIVGVSADRYNLYLGGNLESTRLNRLHRELVPFAELGPAIDDVLVAFRRERRDGERFGDYCRRTAEASPAIATAGD